MLKLFAAAFEAKFQSKHGTKILIIYWKLFVQILAPLIKKRFNAMVYINKSRDMRRWNIFIYNVNIDSFCNVYILALILSFFNVSIDVYILTKLGYVGRRAHNMHALGFFLNINIRVVVYGTERLRSSR
jgi:hypothetical protein